MSDDDKHPPVYMYRSAAIRHNDTGKIYEGSWHGAARDMAEQDGWTFDEIMDCFQNGFVTTTGEFHDRHHAKQVIREMLPSGKMIEAEAIDMMIREILPLNESVLIHEDLNEGKKQLLRDYIASSKISPKES
jgi:hypothetical protein